MSLANVIGQSGAVEMLRQSLRQGRLVHCYLFCGPRGVGKMFTALALAKTLNCLSGGEDACGECVSCRKVDAGVHPDIRVIAPEGDSIKIDQVRAVRRQAHFSPVEGRTRVFIVEEAGSMTVEAANSLLRIMEEPPPHVLFILLAVDVFLLPPTVVSRCHVVRFERIPLPLIEEALVARFGRARDDARFLAQTSGGILESAIRGERDDPTELLLSLVGLANGVRPTELLSLAGKLEAMEEKLPAFLDFLLLWLRDALVWRGVQDSGLLVSGVGLPLVREVAGAFSHAQLRGALGAVEGVRTALRQNANKRLALEAMLVRLAGLWSGSPSSGDRVAREGVPCRP